MDDSTNVLFTCAVCDQPTEPTRDLTADERGRSVHQQCYDERLLSSLGRWGKQLMCNLEQIPNRERDKLAT